MASIGYSGVASDPWTLILKRLKSKISPENFEHWIEPVRFDRVEPNGVLHLRAPNPSAAQWLELEYKGRILETAGDLSLEVKSVCFDAAADETVSSQQVRPIVSAPPVQGTFDFRGRNSTFSSKYVFDSFVVGSCNEFAHAAAQAVAAKPANAYNPLYIYGGVGMGKTHLMHAIGQQLQANFSGMRVVYVSSEEFMNEMITSLRYDSMSTFHERFRTADALLVDDIQTLGSRERTQEEFFHTFNALHNMQKQIVISSDLPPKQVPGLVDRLRSRFSWGLMADIQPPDLETKMAILDRKADEAGIDLPDPVRSFLATNLRSNIRELEGALIRLVAISSVADTDITLQMAKQSLRSMASGGQRRATIASIQRAVAEEYGLRPQQLREKTNAKAISYPRQVAMYLCKELTGGSLPEIGKAFGGKHHTTVLHAVNKIDRLRQDDKDLNSRLHSLTDRFD